MTIKKIKKTKKKKITKKRNKINKSLRGGSTISLRPQRFYTRKLSSNPNIIFNASRYGNAKTQKEYLSEQQAMSKGYENKTKECDIPYNKDGKMKLPFQCYGRKVYELSNQSIGIEYDKNFVFYTITPLALSVPTMQLAANTGSISISEPDKDGNQYLGFIKNFPSLVIQQAYNYTYTTRPLETEEYKDIHETRPEAKWFDVTEDSETFGKEKFEIIEEGYMNCNGGILYKYKYELNTNTSSHPLLNSIIKIKYYNNDETQFRKNQKSIYISNCTNLETFVFLTEKVRELIKEIKQLLMQTKENVITSNSRVLPKTVDELLFERKLAISRVIYRAHVKFNSNGKEHNDYIIENIRWVVENALWVEKYLELKSKAVLNKYGEIANLLMPDNPEYAELQNPMYKSDFTGLDSRFFIVDESIDEYIIVGYPEKQMKEHILNFWQLHTDGSNKAFYDEFNGLNNNLTEDIVKLFNEFQKEAEKINNESEYFKLYIKLRKPIFDYIQKRYEELNSKYKNKVSDEDLEKFKIDFFKNANSYFQQIALKYLPKPMLFIKYIFLVFKKDEDEYDNVKLTPMVFNIKELKPEHQPILKKIERLIKHELPYRFGILNDAEYNNGIGTSTDPFDDEYKLWYSRYRYGKFFHINTEYVHTMSNISDKAHGYQNSITLEEIIYSCSLLSNQGNQFFKDFKLEYQVREFQINNYIILYSKKINNSENLELNNAEQLIDSGSRSKKVFNLYDKLTNMNSKVKLEIKTVQKQNLTIKLTNLDISNMKFILIFKSNNQEYTIIYLITLANNTAELRKLVIKSNMKSEIKQIIKQLGTKNNNSFNSENKLFKIITHKLLDFKYYNNIFLTHPFITRKINKVENYIQNNKLDTFFYYSTDLLDYKKTNNTILLLYNLYEDKPILIKNYLKIIDNNYNENKLLINSDKDHFWSCMKTDCNDIVINYVFKNLNNCGYYIIEILHTNENKIVIYIYPIGNSKFLRNFLDLDETSILMLEEVKKLYYNSNYLCFLHKTNDIRTYCLHFHITKKDYYDREYNPNNSDISLLNDVYISNLINLVKIDCYKNDYDISFIRIK